MQCVGVVLAVCLVAVTRADPAPVDSVDLDKYVGNWYQIYTNQAAFTATRQEDNAACVTVRYGKVSDTNVTVENIYLRGIDGSEDVTTGYASTTDTPGVLSVKFDNIPVTFPYSIAKLGPVKNNMYDYAIVTGGANTMYVLARRYDDFKDLYDSEVKAFLEQEGYNEGDKAAIMTPQSEDCAYPDSFTSSATHVQVGAMSLLTVCLALFL